MNESLLRRIKAENEALLLSWGIEVNAGLPYIEDVSEVDPRTGSEVAARAVALGYIVRLGLGAPAAALRPTLDRYELWPALSNREKRLLASAVLSDQEKIDCTWLAEAIQALLWAVGRADLRHDRRCDDDLASRVPFEEDPAEFIASAQLRAVAELQYQCDLLYRLHWYIRNCRLLKQECVFPEGPIWERRRALDWAYGVEADWDSVPGDT